MKNTAGDGISCWERREFQQLFGMFSNASTVDQVVEHLGQVSPTMLTRRIALHTSHCPAHVASPCTRHIALHTSHRPVHLASPCTRHIALHTSHRPAHVALPCTRRIALHTSHRPAHVASPCTRRIALHTSHCPAHVASPCTRRTALHTSHCPAHVASSPNVTLKLLLNFVCRRCNNSTCASSTMPSLEFGST
jgi:hypothetical protein